MVFMLYTYTLSSYNRYMDTETKYQVSATPVFIKPLLRPKTKKRSSRGGTDEINPEEIIYGEYSYDDKQGEYIDLLYIDGEIIRFFSGGLVRPDNTFDELVLLLRDDSKYYLVEIKEVAKGFAFKRNDISDIKNDSIIKGNANHAPSCVWTLKFEDGKSKNVETNCQPYFDYGNTTRPRNMTNRYILDKMLPRS